MTTKAGKTITFDASEAISRINIRVKLPRMMRLRFRVAAWLFKLAGTISGTTVIIDVGSE